MQCDVWHAAQGPRHSGTGTQAACAICTCRGRPPSSVHRRHNPRFFSLTLLHCAPCLLLLGMQVPRAATIHEYLDWTVTASEAEDPDELVRAGAIKSATK